MSKINGTNLLIYLDGQVVAAQRGASINVDVDLLDATDKFSGGFENFETGKVAATIDFDALFSTEGLSAEDLIEKLQAGEDLLTVIEITGSNNVFVGGSKPKSLKVNADAEQLMSVSGSLQMNYIFQFSENCLTNWVNVSFNTFTSSGNKITSATGDTNDYAVIQLSFSDGDLEQGDVLVFFTYLTINNTDALTFHITDTHDHLLTDAFYLNNGFNCIRLTITGTIDSTTFYGKLVAKKNSLSFSTSNCYLLKL